MERLQVRTNRGFEFFRVRELEVQMGTLSGKWGTAIAKELIDNALDSCETAKIANPTIQIDFIYEDDGYPAGFTVTDNGTGLPESVMRDTLNYDIRVSDKQSYISPTRGQQGNGLKTCFAAPVVLNGDSGVVSVATVDYGYRVTMSINHISQGIDQEFEPIARIDKGTAITIYSSRLASQLHDKISDIATSFALFNPHAQLIVNGKNYQPAPLEKFNKWLPNQPCSAHWYNSDTFSKLVADTLRTHQESGRRSPTIRTFVGSNFDGLKRPGKQKSIGSAMEPCTVLDDLANGKGIDLSQSNRLLILMQEASTPVKPARLGYLGEKFIKGFLDAQGYPLEHFKYKKVEIGSAKCPAIVEVALTGNPCSERKIYWGLNFSPMLLSEIPWGINYALGLDNVLIDSNDPILLVFHITAPKFQFKDRGKTSLDLTAALTGAIQTGLEAIAKEWVKVKKRKKRQEQATIKELDQALKTKTAKISDKAAAYQVMERAYMAASDNNRLPANARQIMYQARPLILELTGKGKLSDKYFTQTLLPDYIRENPETTAHWDVLYDARGHFTEPHTGEEVALGTLGVRNYVNHWRRNFHSFLTMGGSLSVARKIGTSGNHNRYKFALFIEKEGFTHILDSANISRRYDIAIFSTKGMSNTSARHLVEKLSNNGVTILVAHDFDKPGLTIARTLREDTRRYQFTEAPNVIDIGLRLPDIEAMGLGSEPVTYPKSDPRPELRNCECSQAEIDFLCSHKIKPYSGDRVELNAMTSSQLIAWLEQKFSQHGVTKFVPDSDTLAKAYRLQYRRRCLEKFIRDKLEKEAQEEIDRLGDLEINVPEKLDDKVKDILKANPLIPWDIALWEAAKHFQEKSEGELPR